MIERLPATIAAVCLSVYWFWVVVKLIRLGRKLGKDPNALPREWVGIALRLIWYPTILVLLAALWLEAVGPSPLRGWAGLCFGRLWPQAAWWWPAATAAAGVCVILTVMTFICWRQMGRSWRIGIDPGEKLDLVSTGPYRFVRHPIYALRMVIDTCVILMAPIWVVLAACLIDMLLLQIEARREERYMESKHGAAYQEYKKSVGRFVPRAFVV